MDGARHHSSRLPPALGAHSPSRLCHFPDQRRKHTWSSTIEFYEETYCELLYTGLNAPLVFDDLTIRFMLHFVEYTLVLFSLHWKLTLFEVRASHSW